jgi:hypothetical protein
LLESWKLRKQIKELEESKPITGSEGAKELAALKAEQSRRNGKSECNGKSTWVTDEMRAV